VRNKYWKWLFCTKGKNVRGKTWKGSEDEEGKGFLKTKRNILYFQKQ